MTPAELKKKLVENGSTGLDLSPGDPVALEAYHYILDLEKVVLAYREKLDKISDAVY